MWSCGHIPHEGERDQLFGFVNRILELKILLKREFVATCDTKMLWHETLIF